jgi:hypothetical protein
MAVDHHRVSRHEPVLDHGFLTGDARDGDRTHVDRLIGLHEIDVRAVGTGLHRQRRDHGGGGFRHQAHHDVNELSWPQLPVGIRKGRFDLDGAGGLIDRVIDERDSAGCEMAFAARRACFDTQGTARHVASQIR